MAYHIHDWLVIPASGNGNNNNKADYKNHTHPSQWQRIEREIMEGKPVLPQATAFKIDWWSVFMAVACLYLLYKNWNG